MYERKQRKPVEYLEITIRVN